MATEKIVNFYGQYDEEGRLFRDKAHMPEYLTTVRYFDRVFLPASKVLDACAGTGKYAFYLAGQGHRVTALDLVPHNIELIAKNAKANQLAEIGVCDILDLSRYADGTFDVVLCMGAMYHLQYNDRALAMAECVRVCKPGGLVVLSYLNRFAVIAAEVTSGLGNLSNVLAAFEDESDFLFKAVTPEEMAELAMKNNLEITHHIGTDGISFVLADKVNSADEEAFDHWMEYIYEACETSSALAYSMHGLLIGKTLN